MVNYWNNIDNEIELNMDVIDDPLGEAQEIHRYLPLLSLVRVVLCCVVLCCVVLC